MQVIRSFSRPAAQTQRPTQRASSASRSIGAPAAPVSVAAPRVDEVEEDTMPPEGVARSQTFLGLAGGDARSIEVSEQDYLERLKDDASETAGADYLVRPQIAAGLSSVYSRKPRPSCCW